MRVKTHDNLTSDRTTSADKVSFKFMTNAWRRTVLEWVDAHFVPTYYLAISQQEKSSFCYWVEFCERHASSVFNLMPQSLFWLKERDACFEFCFTIESHVDHWEANQKKSVGSTVMINVFTICSSSMVEECVSRFMIISMSLKVLLWRSPYWDVSGFY